MKIEMLKIPEDTRILKFLYETIIGRTFLKILCSSWISKIAGLFLDSKISTCLISSFIKKNQIDVSQYEQEDYKCFNDFFIRKIRKDLRPIDLDDDSFIAPCDGLLSAYRISDSLIVPVKQSQYSLEDLLQNKELADNYRNGVCLVFRLCVNHYHRYCYIDSGDKSENTYIKGLLHTVRPIALRNTAVFTRNSREYTVINSKKYGPVLQMEVGAMLVGKIHNYHQTASVNRGEEKGYFKYGGSTVIVLVKEGIVDFPSDLFEACNLGMEVPVIMGQKLGNCIEN